MSIKYNKVKQILDLHKIKYEVIEELNVPKYVKYLVEGENNQYILSLYPFSDRYLFNDVEDIVSGYTFDYYYCIYKVKPDTHLISFLIDRIDGINNVVVEEKKSIRYYDIVRSSNHEFALISNFKHNPNTFFEENGLENVKNIEHRFDFK